MKDVPQVAIVDPTEGTRESIRDLLLGIEKVKLELECTCYEFFIRSIQVAGVPDLVIISLDGDRDKALILIQQLADLFPQLPIVAASGRKDGATILLAWKYGVKEFLTLPAEREDLLIVLSRMSRIVP